MLQITYLLYKASVVAVRFISYRLNASYTKTVVMVIVYANDECFPAAKVLAPVQVCLFAIEFPDKHIAIIPSFIEPSTV